MKYIYLLIAFFYFSCAGNSKTPGNESSENNIEMIKTSQDEGVEYVEMFYQEYISALLEMPMDLKKIETIENNYLSNKLLTQLRNKQLDYDPFLNAQDFEEDIFEKMKFENHPESTNMVKVSYEDEYTGKIVTLQLELIEDNGSYKINSIQ